MAAATLRINCWNQLHNLKEENKVLKARIKELEERIIGIAKFGLQNIKEYHEIMDKLAISLQKLIKEETH